MKTKECKKCKIEKCLDEYYAHPKANDGHDSTCKECRKEANRLNRRNKKEYYREYDRRRSRRQDRVDARRRYQEYMKSEKPNEWNVMRYETNKKYRQKNKIKIKAWSLLDYHVKNGDIKRGLCAVCGDQKTEGHHPDYNYPLSVIWLCDKHHKEEHKRLNQENRQ